MKKAAICVNRSSFVVWDKFFLLCLSHEIESLCLIDSAAAGMFFVGFGEAFVIAPPGV